GAFTIRYAVSNGRGGVDTAFLQVTVTDDAEPLPPRAEDRSVPLEDVVGVAEVPVPLDGLIAHPGGRTAALEVTVERPTAHPAPLPPRPAARPRPRAGGVAGAAVPAPLDGPTASPRGRTEDLEVTAEGPNAHRATVARAPQTITVRPGPRRPAIAYRVAN